MQSSLQRLVVMSCLGGVSNAAILAAINAVHTDAPSAADTDWSQVVALYDQLVRIDPSPVVALNATAPASMARGPV